MKIIQLTCLFCFFLVSVLQAQSALGHRPAPQAKKATFAGIKKQGSPETTERFIRDQVQRWDFFQAGAALEKSSMLVLPNPVQSEMAVTYKILVPETNVEISLQSLATKQRVKLFADKRTRGEYQDYFKVAHLKRGIYILTVKTDSLEVAERVILE